MNHHLQRPLPERLQPLAELALDLRWTGSQTAVSIWRRLDSEMWERTRNPWALLMNVHQERLEEAAQDADLLARLDRWIERRDRHEREPTWFDGQAVEDAARPQFAYFSMEFGLSEALPIYSGGLGMLAGDHLKSASSQGLPLVAVGLLYQQGYFRQVIDDDGSQRVLLPFNEPGSLPVRPVEGPDGRWPRLRLELPGRTLILRLWEARVGAVRLLLLDSNDPMNSAEDRAITAQLYNADRQTRLLQELVLGVGGWQMLRKLGMHPEVCHLNEGHAAFAVVARAADYARENGLPFETGLWATRAGNVFTTHTPVEAAFDCFDAGMLSKFIEPFAAGAGVDMERLLELGASPSGPPEMFNMAFLAMRGCARVNGVSRLHGEVSRRLFAPLFPGWPFAEVPVSHVTNGIHVPTWDSAAASRLWRQMHPHGWSARLEESAAALGAVGDRELWDFRNEARGHLVEYVRERAARRCRARGGSEERVERCSRVLDPRILTIGFARRFTRYKRPGLLFHDPERLARLLAHPERPVQILVAGKAHPNDGEGAEKIRQVVRFCTRDDIWDRTVFLEDYDMAVAEQLTGGADIWLNNPARPNEACGTSGMKALVNGGLHVSTLDGWWDEAYAPGLGWAIGDRVDASDQDEAADAAELYRLLEEEIVPEFYDRDAHGLPRRWLKRVRDSMMTLVPVFSSDRMVREYAAQAYLPAVAQFRERDAGCAALARELEQWQATVRHGWERVSFGDCRAVVSGASWCFRVELWLGTLTPGDVRVELCSEDPSTGRLEPVPMVLERPPAHGADFAVYSGSVSNQRPAGHFTPRVIAWHPAAVTPLEAPFILWQK